MNLVADEGVDRLVVERLRRDGHYVIYVAELAPSVADDEVLRLGGDCRIGDWIHTTPRSSARYWMASARWSERMRSLSARSAMVRATRRMRS